MHNIKGRIHFMFARISLILTLIVGLLLATQPSAIFRPVEVKRDGNCAGGKCWRGCCANMACCAKTEQRNAPPAPGPAHQQVPVQLADLGLRIVIRLFTPPVRMQAFGVPDEASVVHSRSPLAVTCIQLI
jgi:hypothetical protein